MMQMTTVELDNAYKRLEACNETLLEALGERDIDPGRYEVAQQAAGEAARDLGAKLAELGQ